MWLNEQYPKWKEARKKGNYFYICRVSEDIQMNNYVGGIIGNLGISGKII